MEADELVTLVGFVITLKKFLELQILINSDTVLSCSDFKRSKLKSPHK